MFRNDRHLNLDGCAASDSREDCDLTLMRFDNSADDGQAKPGTFDFCGRKNRPESSFTLLFGHALASIFEFDDYVLGVVSIL